MLGPTLPAPMLIWCLNAQIGKFPEELFFSEIAQERSTLLQECVIGVTRLENQMKLASWSPLSALIEPEELGFALISIARTKSKKKRV